MYERTVRQLTGHNDFALPYWDWTADRQLPAAFTQPTWNGQPNPLYESQRSISPTDSLPDEIVGQGVIATVLGETPFETFGTSRPSGQDSLDQSWINCEGCGVSGTLEATPHNNVHNIVGGLMGGTQSALDPIFMMHHCNIDRIWAVWNVNNQNSNDPLWTGMTFQNNFYNPDGSFYSPKVSDLYTPETLGYAYGLAPPLAAAVAPAVMALGDKIKTLFATPNVSSAAGIKTFTAPNVQQAMATANKPLDIAVEVDRSLLTAVARRAPAGAGSELLDFNSARERAASGPRTSACLHSRHRGHAAPEYAVQGVHRLRLSLAGDADFRSSLHRHVRNFWGSSRPWRQAGCKAVDRPRSDTGDKARLRQRDGAYRPHPDSNLAGAEQINRRSDRNGRAGAHRSCVRLRLSPYQGSGRHMCMGRREWVIAGHA
jgi:Common central domain of tyrosinase/Polyphenol oxidase middle domain